MTFPNADAGGRNAVESGRIPPSGNIARDDHRRPLSPGGSGATLNVPTRPAPAATPPGLLCIWCALEAALNRAPQHAYAALRRVGCCPRHSNERTL